MLYGKFDGTAVDYMSEDHQFLRDDNILFVYAGERMEPDTIKMIRDEILVKVCIYEYGVPFTEGTEKRGGVKGAHESAARGHPFKGTHRSLQSPS